LNEGRYKEDAVVQADDIVLYLPTQNLLKFLEAGSCANSNAYLRLLNCARYDYIIEMVMEEEIVLFDVGQELAEKY
jgi:hypothetical protein